MIAPLVATLTVAFPGGDLSELARSLAENTNRNVVLLAGGSERTKAFSYDPADANELSRSVFNATGFRQAPGLDLIFHRGRLPSWLFEGAAFRLLSGTETSWQVGAGFPPDTLLDGKLTLQHKPGQALSIESLTTLSPKPVVLHWTFENLALKAWVSDQSVKEFIAYIAKAVGGRVVERKDSTFLDFDAVEGQRRALKTVEAVSRHPQFKNLKPESQEEVEWLLATLSSATPSQFGEAMATPGSKARIPIGPALRSLVQRRLERLLKEPEAEVPQDRSLRPSDAPPGPLEVLKRIDRRLIGYAELKASLSAQIFLQTINAQGRPGPVVPMP